MPTNSEFLISINDKSPLVATAIHDGHALRPEVARRMGLSEAERLREEDPYTGVFAKTAPTWVLGTRSRFEVDLNRPRDEAVYLEPSHAWGLDVWRTTPGEKIVERSLKHYDQFYDLMEHLLTSLLERHERVVVLDIHSYNHRRHGPLGPVASCKTHPEVNIGTGSMDREIWAPVVDGFISSLRSRRCAGHALDVRENVKFRGGHFPTWIHETFPNTVCAIAIEFKKCFMDEWTGEPDMGCVEELSLALRDSLPAVLTGLREMPGCTLSAPLGSSS